jgi:hypothetical protein
VCMYVWWGIKEAKEIAVGAHKSGDFVVVRL